MTKRKTADFGNEPPITIRISRDHHRLLRGLSNNTEWNCTLEAALQKLIRGYLATLQPGEQDLLADGVAAQREADMERLEAQAVAIRAGGLSLSTPSTSFSFCSRLYRSYSSSHRRRHHSLQLQLQRLLLLL